MARVFIGYDKREDLAFRVCRASLERQGPVGVSPIVEREMRRRGLYGRELTRQANGLLWDEASAAACSTDFAFTRFLVPWLAEGQDFALFCDCDFLFTQPVAELFALADPRYAVQVRKHAFAVNESAKMDGQAQQRYPRKWWSALVLWNLRHPAHRRLALADVSRRPGRWLHGFGWLDDSDIGDLPETWHWLEGYSPPSADGRPPAAIHFTRGGPWFENWRKVAYGDLWTWERARLAAGL